jgi:opacity protein-like surface antigen
VRRLQGVVLVLILLVTMLPGALWAQPPTQSPARTQPKTDYVILKLGGYLPESSDMNNVNADNGFAGRIAFGHYVTNIISVEAALGYQEFTATKDIERKYQMFPLEAAGKFGLPLGIVEPYLTVGLGGYYVKAKARNTEEDSYRAGFFGGAGVNINLGDSAFIGVEGRYQVLTAEAPSATPYSTTTGDVNLDGFLVTGNLGFRF